MMGGWEYEMKLEFEMCNLEISLLKLKFIH